MIGSVTRTMSATIITIELSGNFSFALPIMIANASSYLVSEYIKPESFYEMLQVFHNLDEKISGKGKILIKDLLDSNKEYENFDFLSLNECTDNDLINMIKSHCDYKNHVHSNTK